MLRLGGSTLPSQLVATKSACRLCLSTKTLRFLAAPLQILANLIIEQDLLSRDGDSDPGPTVYKTVALPLSYLGDVSEYDFTSKGPVWAMHFHSLLYPLDII